MRTKANFEVCKRSATIINKLKDFLLKYKLNEPLPQSPLPQNIATIDSSYVKYEPPDNITNSISKQMNSNSISVIEEIVDANDTNLLASICKKSMKMDEETEKMDEKTFQSISCVTRQVFLQRIFNSDIDAYIEDRNRWLSTYTTSFESIIDDILTVYKKGDVNSMDCY